MATLETEGGPKQCQIGGHALSQCNKGRHYPSAKTTGARRIDCIFEDTITVLGNEKLK